MKLIGSVVVFAALLSACGRQRDMKVPDYTSNVFTCQRGEHQQPGVSSEVMARRLLIDDTIPSGEVEYLGCKGEVNRRTHGPQRALAKAIWIDPPTSLPDQVDYVTVENARTCASHAFEAQDAISANDVLLPLLSVADRTGRALLSVTDSNLKLNIRLNVADGLNILKVSYFKCLVKTSGPEPRRKFALPRCAQSKILGTQDVALQVNVKRPATAEIKRVPTCGTKAEAL